MMRTVQLALADAGYAASLRDALSHSGPWQADFVEHPDPARPGVVVLDESAFGLLRLPFAHPERVVLISRQDPQLLAQAWDAGIVSVVSLRDSLPTVLLAIMAAALRVSKSHEAVPSEISANPAIVPARIFPENQISRSRHCRTP